MSGLVFIESYTNPKSSNLAMDIQSCWIDLYKGDGVPYTGRGIWEAPPWIHPEPKIPWDLFKSKPAIPLEGFSYNEAIKTLRKLFHEEMQGGIFKTILEGDLDDFFGLFKLLSQDANKTFPKFDLLEIVKGKEYRLEFGISGYKKDQIEVQYAQKPFPYLVIRGKSAPEEDTKNYSTRGLKRGNFERVIPLSTHIEVGEVKVEDGILAIELKINIPEEMRLKSLEVK